MGIPTQLTIAQIGITILAIISVCSASAPKFTGYDVKYYNECQQPNTGRWYNVRSAQDCLRKCGAGCVSFVYQPDREQCKIYDACTLKENSDPVTETYLYLLSSQEDKAPPRILEFELIPNNECREANSGKFYGVVALDDCTARCRSGCAAFIYEPARKECKIYEKCTRKEYPYNPDPKTTSWLYDRSSGSTETVPECNEDFSPRWTMWENSACTGREHFTLRKWQTIIHETDPYDDNDFDVVESWQYDGTLEKCQEVFVMDYWDNLLNPEISVGRGSKLTWDPRDGSCKLYSSGSGACDGIRKGSDTFGMISGLYCNFNS